MNVIRQNPEIMQIIFEFDIHTIFISIANMRHFHRRFPTSFYSFYQKKFTEKCRYLYK